MHPLCWDQFYLKAGAMRVAWRKNGSPSTIRFEVRSFERYDRGAASRMKPYCMCSPDCAAGGNDALGAHLVKSIPPFDMITRPDALQLCALQLLQLSLRLLAT